MLRLFWPTIWMKCAKFVLLALEYAELLVSHGADVKGVCPHFTCLIYLKINFSNNNSKRRTDTTRRHGTWPFGRTVNPWMKFKNTNSNRLRFNTLILLCLQWKSFCAAKWLKMDRKFDQQQLRCEFCPFSGLLDENKAICHNKFYLLLFIFGFWIKYICSRL